MAKANQNVIQMYSQS